MQSPEKQKISELEQNLQVLKETVTAMSVAFGTKLLNESARPEARELIREELINNWNKDVAARKQNTDSILKIKTTLEREQQLQGLKSETENLLRSKEKEINSLKAEFALRAYQNHREDFADEIERLPELSQLEAQIEAEKNKIDNRNAENEQKSFFEKFMPAIKNILSRGKVSSTENKVKKIVKEKNDELFSDEDFDSLCELIDELPADLGEIVGQLKDAKAIRTSAGTKLDEIKSDIASVDTALSEMNALNDSKTKISSLMQEIKILDDKIENTAILACNTCVDKFFTPEGQAITDNNGVYSEQIKKIGDIRKKYYVAELNIDLTQRQQESVDLQRKIQNNIEKIEKMQKQIKNLNDEIVVAENQNNDMNLSIQDLENEMQNLRSKIEAYR